MNEWIVDSAIRKRVAWLRKGDNKYADELHPACTHSNRTAQQKRQKIGDR